MSEDVDTGMPPPEFFDEMAKHCRCCPDCEVEPPCGACCAGGVCDHFRCTCSEDDEYDRSNEGDDDMNNCPCHSPHPGECP